MARNGDSDNNSSIYSILAEDELKPNYANYVVCPYDKHHVLRPTRLALHLIKCGRNHPGNNLIRCPFNTSHVLKSADLREHISNCANHIDFMRINSKEELPSQTPSSGIHDLVECAENWNEEPETKAYNPQEYCQKNLLLRNCVGQAPAKRREFREMQRKKFKELSEGKEM